MPASCVIADNVLDTLVAKSLPLDLVLFTVSFIEAISFLSTGWSSNNRSIKNRYPLGVGIRPADVCGDAINPRSSRSDITFLIVAGLKSKRLYVDNFLEPIGIPFSI